MRKSAVFALLAVFAIVGMLVPPVYAQAQPPKVTITGFIDQVTSWSKNMSTEDNNYQRAGEVEWYARTRVRPDIVAEVGTAKMVLGLEIDLGWGQVGGSDSNLRSTNTIQRAGTSGGADLNTDVPGVVEIKWAYTEFDVPFIPWATRLRLGLQAFATAYKSATLANGDFAGVNLTTTVAPNVKFNFTYAQIEEGSSGSSDAFTRGEDYAIITSVELTPFKGLDIRPIYAWTSINGVTNGATRQGRGGVPNAGATGTTAGAFTPGFCRNDATTAGGPAVCGQTDAHEGRHTIGVDARWRWGAFSLDPTVFYQFGERELYSTLGARNIGANARKQGQDLDAWLVDVRGGWQAGPLLVEGAVIYTTGNKASQDIRNANEKVRFFQPINLDTSFYAGWAEVWALGIDYFNILYNQSLGLNPGVAIGYDKYGLFRLGSRASYALTPAFTVRTAVTANWTDKAVDTSGVITAANGLTPSGLPSNGDTSYLGTEWDLGLQYRIPAAGLTFDLVGGYMWAGQALSSALSASINPSGIQRQNLEPKDVQTVAFRARYSF